MQSTPPTLVGRDLGAFVKPKQPQQLLVVHQIRAHQLGAALVHRRGEVRKPARPRLAGFVPALDGPSGERVGRRLAAAADVEIEAPVRVSHHHLARAVAEQLVQNDPPVVRGELVPLERVQLRRVDKGGSAAVGGHGGFRRHSVRDDDVFETVLLADVVVLRELSVWHSWLVSGVERGGWPTFGRLMPGNMMLEQYARAVECTSVLLNLCKELQLIWHTVNAGEVGRIKEGLFKRPLSIVVLKAAAVAPWQPSYKSV